jgi:AcrR family transcriptional regulator
MLSTAEKIDPRVVRTRKLLIDSFLSLMGEKPFEEITVQDITMRATVNRATFYAHFLDKYALVDSIIQTGFAGRLAQSVSESTETPNAYLERIFLAIAEHLVALDAQCRRSYQTFERLVEAQIKGQVREHVRAWLEGQLRPRATTTARLDVAATLLSWSLYGAALEWKTRGQAQSAESFGRDALPMIAAMVQAAGAERG